MTEAEHHGVSDEESTVSDLLATIERLEAEKLAELTRHRLAYEKLLGQTADARTRITEQAQRIARLEEQTESLRSTNAAMRSKLDAIERRIPRPLRNAAKRIGRKVSGQDDA